MDAIRNSSEVTVITVTYGVIFVAGVVANVLACVVIVAIKEMHTPANCYLFSLAISDFMLLLSGLPYELYLIRNNTSFLCFPAFCVIRTLISEACNNSTTLTLCAFALKRYLIVCHPMWSYRMVRISTTIKIILGVWVVAVALSVFAALKPQIVIVSEKVCYCKAPVIGEHYFGVSAILLFVLPMVLICVLCTLVCVNLKRRREELAYNSAGQGDAASRRAIKLLSK